jgi:hypothetical protein
MAYYSKTLITGERSYCISQRELLAVVKTLKHFHKYSYGQKFPLRTDHYALYCLSSFKNLGGKRVR